MSVIGSNILAGASGQGGGYNLTNSLRIRQSASAYLSRTPASAGNRKTWTYSTWVKRGALGTSPLIQCATTGAVGIIYFYSGNELRVNLSTSFSDTLITNQVFRDTSAWYHIIVATDTTQASSGDRCKIYVNGVQVTSFSSQNFPSQNFDTQFNLASQTRIGNSTALSAYFDGYVAETHFIDGQALTPSSFGEFSTKTGVWQPKRYAGTYGTNGFYLPFTDNSSLTTSSNVGLGKDFSGNGNYWTTNNISLTAGVTYDSMTDVPTLTSATASNFCVMNPVANFTGTLSNGNLTLVTTVPGNDKFCQATFKLPKTGKWYWENTISIANSADARNRQVIANAEPNGTSFGSINAYFNCHSAVILSTATVNSNLNTAVITGGGGTVSFAYDADVGSLWMIKDSSINTGSTANVTGLSNANGDLAYMITEGSGSVSGTNNLNFGQRPFAYTPPTGYVALNTYNLP